MVEIPKRRFVDPFPLLPHPDENHSTRPLVLRLDLSHLLSFLFTPGSVETQIDRLVLWKVLITSNEEKVEGLEHVEGDTG